VEIVAFVDDLMDRSRLSGALPGVRFVRSVDDLGAGDVVIIDLGRHRDLVRAVRGACSTARIIGFGPHVDDDAMQAARQEGADTVLPRSLFFRDPAVAVGL
jgi:hypothetical protein